MKFFDKILKHKRNATKHCIVNKILCKHSTTAEVIIEDSVYDRRTDNDDLEDQPTKVSITYCKDCGKIIKVKIVDNIPTSSYQEIKEFYEVTKYNLRQNSPIEDFLNK